MASSPKTSFQSSVVDTHQKEVMPDEWWHVPLECSNYIATSWYLLTVLIEHFTPGTADFQDSHTPTVQGLFRSQTYSWSSSNIICTQDELSNNSTSTLCVALAYPLFCCVTKPKGHRKRGTWSSVSLSPVPEVGEPPWAQQVPTLSIRTCVSSLHPANYNP